MIMIKTTNLETSLVMVSVNSMLLENCFVAKLSFYLRKSVVESVYTLKISEAF